jgi:hypothetical protein
MSGLDAFADEVRTKLNNNMHNLQNCEPLSGREVSFISGALDAFRWRAISALSDNRDEALFVRCSDAKRQLDKLWADNKKPDLEIPSDFAAALHALLVEFRDSLKVPA